MTINNYNFIIPLINDNGEDIRIYINQPLENEMRRIASVLAHIFTLIKDNKLDLIIFLKDWDVILEEYCETIDKGQDKLKAVNTFIDRCILTARYFTSEGEVIEKLSNDELFMVKGALVFLSALYRYSFKMLKNTEMTDFFTSLNVTDFQNTLLPSRERQHVKSGVIMRRS